MEDPVPGGDEEASPLVDSRTVLVFTADARAAGAFVGALQRRGMPTLIATESRWVLHWLREIPPTIILFDLTAPGSGILLHELRRQGRCIVALSDDPQERQRALEGGCIEAHHRGDAPDELALHLSTLIRTRRIRRVGRIAAGDLVVDLTERCLRLGEREIRVSPLLLDVAAYLAARPGQLIPSRTILEDVWGEPWDRRLTKVHVTMLRLRRALELPSDSTFLTCRQAHGYGIFPDLPVPTAARSL